MKTLMQVMAAVSVSLVLAGCGADGEPVQPTLNANVGVGTSGAYVGGGVGLNKGPIGVYVGL